MNSRRYLPGELHGIETARRRSYVATIRYDDDLAIDWYDLCRREGMPFVQCAFRRKYHTVDYDLGPFMEARPGITGLTPDALSRLEHVARDACTASPNRQARCQIGETSGLITGIPRDDAHRLARQLAAMFRNLHSYERFTEGEPA